MRLPDISAEQPVLIAGATASGKSALAMEIAARHGGIIVNADASQIYKCWRVVTARPSLEDEAAFPHALYGHTSWDAPYSAGHWLREVQALLGRSERLIIVGGTGLYFKALTEGMVDIPEIPVEIRQRADALPLEALLAALDARTKARIDIANRARVQRAWEVLEATGRPLVAWQDDTPAPVLPITDTVPIVVEADKTWLEARIFKRFDIMIQQGALDEVAAMAPLYDPTYPAFKAIGVPELMRHLRGESDLDGARQGASIATRQFAKRQRTWMRKRMRDWTSINPSNL